MENAMIFGTGIFGVDLAKRIEKEFKVIGFLDNDKNRWDTKIEKIRVFPITEIFSHKVDRIIIGNNSFDSIDNIINQLISIGINREKIVTKYVIKEIPMNIRDVFLNQHNSLDKDGFYRYNLVILYLAIEDMYGKNDFGFNLCKKYRSIVMPEEREKLDEYIDNFKQLIKSFDENGYRYNSYICINKHGDLIDGTHRMALLIYFNIMKVNIRIINTSWTLEGSRDLNWLIKYRDIFTCEEIKIIIKKYEEIKLRL